MIQQKSPLVLKVLLPALPASTRSVAQPLHVGDIRMADLRRVLLDDELTANFSSERRLFLHGVGVV